MFSPSLEARELSKVELGGAYGAIKSFEVLNNAAKRSDSGLGSLLGAGIGLGLAFQLAINLKQVNIKVKKQNSLQIWHQAT